MSFQHKRLTQDYRPLSPIEDTQSTEAMEKTSTDRDSESFVGNLHSPIQRRTSRLAKFMVVLPWILTLIFSSISLRNYISLKQKQEEIGLGSYAKGFVTEFKPALGAIRVEQQRFTGSPQYDSEGNIIVPHPPPVQYVTEPSPELDALWDETTERRYILISEEEAVSTWGDEAKDFWNEEHGGYVAGLDIFHTLHCVNELRKAIWPEYYHPPPEKLHYRHCLEQVRQYIMCSGDLTPVPTRYYESIERNYADSDVLHTCRNFGDLRAWMDERWDGKTALKPAPRGYH